MHIGSCGHNGHKLTLLRHFLAHAQGITNINSINFVASDEAISKAQDEALKLAVKDAQKQGDAVLSAIGAKSQGISGIQVGSASPRM